MSALEHLHTQLRSSLWVVVMTALFTIAIACFWIVGVETARLSQNDDAVVAEETALVLQSHELMKLIESERMGLLRGDEIVSLSIQQDVTHLDIVRDQKPLRIEYRTSEQQK